MKIQFGAWLLASSWIVAGAALANAPSPVSIEIVGADGQVFREFPVNARDGALRSYLQAEKGARYQVRVRNTTGERLGLVIAVDGRNIINGSKSELARTEPMYVLDALRHAGLRRLARQSRCHQRVLFHRLERLVCRGVRRPYCARRHRRRGVWRSAAASSGISAVRRT